MKDSPWGPNPEWGSRKPPLPARFEDGNKPACMSVAVPVGVVFGTVLAWALRRH